LVVVRGESRSQQSALIVLRPCNALIPGRLGRVGTTVAREFSIGSCSEGIAMPSSICLLPASVWGRPAAALVLAICGMLVVAAGADAGGAPRTSAKAPDLFLADAPAGDQPDSQDHQGEHPPSNPPNSSKAPEGNGAPERRQRIRDDRGDDELRGRDRLMLASDLRPSMRQG
jgi:hypothetical protein